MSDPSHLSDETLNEYLDDALSPRDLARAGDHLKGCETCARRLSELAQVFAALESLTDLPVERDLAPGIVEQLRTRSRLSRRPSWKATWRLGLPLAAEVVGTVALLAFAWPQAVAWLTPGPVPSFTGSFTATLEEAAVFLTAVLATPDPLGLETLVSTVNVPGVPWASVSSLMGLLAASTVVWLLGNGLLLRRRRLSPNRRDV